MVYTRIYHSRLMGHRYQSYNFKAFENCVLDRFQNFFLSSDAQFGFKKGIGCRNSIDTVCIIVDRIVERGDTNNLCSLVYSNHEYKSRLLYS